MKANLLTVLVFLVMGCAENKSPQSDMNESKRTEWIEQIRKSEEEFNNMAADKGLKEAFLYFADTNAVLMRGDKIIKGHSEISKYMSESSLIDVSLSWAPDYIDVSDSGDMGYTYGKYNFSATDSTGNQVSSSGIFHTVWKRQSDGSWKYVFD